MGGMDDLDLHRRLRALENALQNCVRDGVIEQIQHNPPLCRVRSGKLLTSWLPWYTQRAGSTRTWSPPTVGEQCTVLSPGGNLLAGRVLIGLYCAANTAPSASADEAVTTYPDGASTTYNHATHTLTINLPAGGSATVNAPESANINTSTAHVQASTAAYIAAPAIELTAGNTLYMTAPITTVDGPLNVLGPLSFAAGMSGQGGGGGSGAAVQITGDLESTGGITAAGEITAASIPLSTHRHSVPEHAGTTGTPQA